jgi:uncharacterized protein involved in exopolysaccharide biosynthesis
MRKRMILEEAHTSDVNTGPMPESQDSVALNSDQAASAFRFDINLFDLARAMVCRKRLIAASVGLAMVLAAAYMFLQPNLYTSQSIILPSGKTNTGNVNALKSLVGLGGPMAVADENSSALFPVVLRSNLVATGVLGKTYTFSDGAKPRSMTLAQYFDEDNPDRLRKCLHDITSVSSDKQTGEIYVSVETAYPELSQAVLTEYLAQLEDFNTDKRLSSAKSDAAYLTRQIETTGHELRAAEDDLESFQMHNMDWNGTSSPEVLKELNRLQREVDVKTSTYTMLAQQLESAKLDAQKDTPVVRVLDAPSLPTLKSGPFRRKVILFAGFLAFLLISAVIIVQDILRQGTAGANHEDYVAFRDDLRQSFPHAERIISRLHAFKREKIPSE